MFTTRLDAGEALSEKLREYQGVSAIVLGIARGGVVVASHVAKNLKLPLDVLVVKKISSPNEQELGIGALTLDDVSYIDWKLAHRVGADEAYLRSQMSDLGSRIKENLLLYRKGKKPLNVKNKTVILIDDGAATGSTLEALILWLRKKKAKKIVIGIPVAPFEVVAKIKPEVHELVVLETPENFSAVGQFYKEFSQVEDADVIQLLQ